MLKKNIAKVVSILVFIAGFAAILLTDNDVVHTAHAISSGPPPGRTGAPGELTCATSGCHGEALNTGPGQFTITAPTTYEAGQTYEIMIRHNSPESNRRRWGFELTALATDNKRAGTFEGQGNFAVVVDDSSSGVERQYVSHGLGGTFQGQTSQVAWAVRWTAPSSNTGAVILYAAGNQANGDGTNRGDQIYTASEVVLSGPPKINSATVNGKKLIITGENLDIGAALLMNDVRQKKTTNDELNLTTSLIAKKAGKQIAPGQSVTLQIMNPDGTLSETFTFTRPE